MKWDKTRMEGIWAKMSFRLKKLADVHVQDVSDIECLNFWILPFSLVACRHFCKCNLVLAPNIPSVDPFCPAFVEEFPAAETTSWATPKFDDLNATFTGSIILFHPFSLLKRNFRGIGISHFQKTSIWGLQTTKKNSKKTGFLMVSGQ